MLRPGTVTGFARSVDLGESRAVLIAALVVAFSNRCRMTVRAGVVPVVSPPGPVQRILRSSTVTRGEREPALPAVADGACIPRDGQRLRASTIEIHDVLLERIEAEGPADLIIV